MASPKEILEKALLAKESDEAVEALESIVPKPSMPQKPKAPLLKQQKPAFKGGGIQPAGTNYVPNKKAQN